MQIINQYSIEHHKYGVIFRGCWPIDEFCLLSKFYGKGVVVLDVDSVDEDGFLDERVMDEEHQVVGGYFEYDIVDARISAGAKRSIQSTGTSPTRLTWRSKSSSL